MEDTKCVICQAEFRSGCLVDGKCTVCVKSYPDAKTRGDINKKKDAVKTLKELNNIVKILPTTDKAMNKAFNCKLKDFEDSIQYETCKEHDIDIIITRNIKDYKRGNIKILTASEFNLINL